MRWTLSVPRRVEVQVIATSEMLSSAILLEALVFRVPWTTLVVATLPAVFEPVPFLFLWMQTLCSNLACSPAVSPHAARGDSTALRRADASATIYDGLRRASIVSCDYTVAT